MNERIWVLTKTESDLSRLSDRIRRKSVEKSSGRSSKTSAKLCQHGGVFLDKDKALTPCLQTFSPFGVYNQHKEKDMVV